MIRLLIVDDSPLMRRLLSEVFAAEGDFEVAVARDGPEALAQLVAFKPDVITLDVQMPGMDGLACLDQIMLERPTPVVMVSSATVAGADETLRALELGAIDVIAKPTGAVSLKMDRLGPDLIDKVRGAASVRIRRTHRLAERLRARRGAAGAPAARRAKTAPAARDWPLVEGEGLVIIGCSTGGPPALDCVLSQLPANLRWPVVVAQHMPSTFTGALARRLDGLTGLSVSEVDRLTVLEPGHVYVCRGDLDAVVGRRPAGLTAMPVPPDPQFRWRPSVDRLVDSALAQMPPSRLVGVLMTGMGYDGAAAMTRLHHQGGRTIAEAEETAVVWGMPGELVRAGGADVVLPREAIAAELTAMVGAA